MAETTPKDFSNESIKSAVAESMRQGADIREKVRDLTLQALKARHLDPREIRQVVHAMTEGISIGAEKRAADMRNAMADALHGLDDALTKSAEAGRLALEQLTTRTKDFSENELKQALANLKKMEEDFLTTVGQVADAAKPVVKEELKDLVGHARRAGTDTGKIVAQTAREFAHRMGSTYVDTQIAGLHAARELSARFTQVASGFLAGLADALRKDETKK